MTNRQPALPGDRGWAPGAFTELRVHGVGNTPLRRLLDDPEPVQVAGDEIAGFYRSRRDRPLTLKTKIDHRLRWTDVEAYDWGGFNSGGGWRAMWILLLPFTLANVSGWLLPRSNGDSRVGRVGVRVFGLGVSTFFVSWITALFLDLLAFQCGSQPTCIDQQIWLKPLGWVWVEGPSDRVGLVLIIPLLVVFALWFWPGRRSHEKYESIQHAGPTDDSSTGLSRSDLWKTRWRVPTLARLHAGAALAAITGGVSFAHTATSDSDAMIDWFLLGFAVLMLVWATSSLCTRRMVGSLFVLCASVVLFAVLVVSSFVVDRPYASFDWVGTDVASPQTTIEMHELVMEDSAAFANAQRRYYMGLNTGVLLVGLLLMVGSIGRVGSKIRTDNQRLWMGWGAPVVGLLGLALAAILIAGLGLWVEETLGDRPSEFFDTFDVERSDQVCSELAAVESCGDVSKFKISGDEGPAALSTQLAETGDVRALPLAAFLGASALDDAKVVSQPVIAFDEIYDIVALGFMATVVVMVVVVAAIQYIVRRRVARRYPVRAKVAEAAASVFVGRHWKERRSWETVGLRDLRQSPRNTRLHWVASVLAAAMFLVGVGLWLDTWFFDGRTGETVTAGVTNHADWLFTAARFAIVGVFGVAALQVSRAYQSGSASQFGGMWDTITFWPREYHPFGVPSYGVRAVPQLAQRIRTCTGPVSSGSFLGKRTTHGRCLISGHSGGVVIALAAIEQLDEATRGRVSLLTYGSPTGSLYGRAFPEYYGADQLGEVATRLASHTADGDVQPRWTNLWRLTDWTGGYAIGPVRDHALVSPDRDRPPRAGVPLVDKLQNDPAIRTMVESPPYTAVPSAIGHTDYLHDPKYEGPEDRRYQNARTKLLFRMR